MTEPEDPEVLAMRERAERVMAARAKRSAEAAHADDGAPTKREKNKAKGRPWYQWVIDGALFLMVLYFIKTRFFDKAPEPPASPPHAASASVAAAAPSVVTRASAEVRVGPASTDAVLETLPPNAAVEVLELSPTGVMKVKTPSGKTGWVPATAVATK